MNHKSGGEICEREWRAKAKEQEEKCESKMREKVRSGVKVRERSDGAMNRTDGGRGVAIERPHLGQ